MVRHEMIHNQLIYGHIIILSSIFKRNCHVLERSTGKTFDDVDVLPCVFDTR